MQIIEKEKIKSEFKDEIDKLKIDCIALENNLAQYNINLRDEIKALGNSKDDLINKRIKEFETEINNIADAFQKLEDKQFKKNGTFKEGVESDKRFYNDYHKKIN
ncbi:MAG: hypothetical protein IPI23_19325 [Bacteroidetes bacterium]|nr:hypothetical protein [Bacteroidota bacterium]